LAGFGKTNKERQMTPKSESTVDYLHSAIQHYQQGNLLEAKQACKVAATREPQNALTIGLLATIEKGLGNLEEAERLFSKSLLIEPRQPDILNNYAGLLIDKGEFKAASILSDKAIRIAPFSAAYYSRMGYALWKAGKHDKALQASTKAIELDPDLVDAYENLGGIHQEQGRLDQALEVTLKAIDLKPDHAGAHMNLGGILKEQGQLDKALEATLKAIELKPDHAGAHMNLGGILKEQGQLDKALEATLKAIELKADHADFHTMLGTIAEAKGDLDKGKDRFNRSLEINPHQGWAYFETSRYLVSTEEATSLLNLIGKVHETTLSPKEIISLAFAKSNCYHKLNEFLNSTKHLSNANKIKIRLKPSKKDDYICITEKLLEAESNAPNTNSSCGKGRVFIVGVPRCGSTLTESILSINPLAADLGETTALPKAIKQLSSNEQNLPFETLEEVYLDQLNMSSVALGITLDKQLYNYMYSGIIASSMPAAKIIHCRRNPLDNILSMYRSNLTVGNNYTSSLEDSAEVLISQENAMRHFKQHYPVSIFTLSYEALVNEPQQQIQQLISWLEWDWNEFYLEPHKSTRVINTASVIQARQPINNKSVGGWKNYAEMLEPARRILIESGLFKSEI